MAGPGSVKDTPVVTLSPEQLQEILRAVVEQATKLNPLEQRKLDEELAKERKKAMMMVTLGRIEEEAAQRKQNGCSHMRDAKTGDGVPRGWPTGEWVTSGQAYQNGTAVIICQRCSRTWLFKPDPSYYNDIIQNGLLKAMPPKDELTLCPGCYELKPHCRCREIHLGMAPAPAVAAA